MDVVVAARDIDPGTEIGDADLAVRSVPERYVAADVVRSPSELNGRRPAVAVPAGASMTYALVDETGGRVPGPPVRRGERAVEVVAAGLPEMVVAGARVDVLITHDDRGSRGGRTELALEDVEVLAATPAPGSATPDSGSGAARVAATLRVTVAQAVDLIAAQSFAREIRLLPRAADDTAGRR